MRRSLKLRFGGMIALLYVVVGGATYAGFQVATARIAQGIGMRFAEKQALLERAKVLAGIQGDLAVSLALTRSPLLRRWALNEQDADLRRLALRELEGYRQSFKAGTCFFIVAASGNYWYLDGKATPEAPRYTLDPASGNDAWYFATLRDVERYALNVDYDNSLDVTNLWINVVVREDGRPLGLGGSGLDLSRFLDELVQATDPGVDTVLISLDGAVQAHPDRRYVVRNSRARGDEAKVRIYDLLDTYEDAERLRAAVTAVTSGHREADTLYLSVEGERHLAAVSFLEELGWVNLVLVDESTVVGSGIFLPVTLIMIGSMLAIALTLSLLLNRMVLGPLTALFHSSRQVAAGNYDVALAVEGEDEIGELGHAFNDMTRKVKDYTNTLEQRVTERTAELDRSTRALSDSTHRLTESIEYARLIQASILPDEATLARVVRDPFVLYRPRDVVGGDFYWCRETANGVVLAVGDCTGHGVPGAFMTMTVSATLGHVVDTTGTDPELILRGLDRRLRGEMRELEAQRGFDHGLDLGVCWLPHGEERFVFAGAGLDLWVVSGRSVSCIEGDRQSVGYAASDPTRQRTPHLVPFEAGAFYVLVTDGLLDQSGGARGHGLGRRRLEAVLLYIAELAPEERSGALANAMAEWQGARPQRDDITVVGFGAYSARRQ
jgi:serine phosphatase RsbU (regulator of sigma subunit)